MKLVILAGGLGTRLGEETNIRPKPLVEIGGRPIIWHIMKYYSHFGINDFVILLGYKGYMIKEFFDNYRRHLYDMKIDFKNNKSEYIRKQNHIDNENWTINLVDTGEHSMTGARLNKAYPYLKEEETFCFTYGDGVSDINLKEEFNFHNRHGKIATMGSVFPPARFGALCIEEDNRISNFIEKPRGDNAYINGGFFILNKEIFNYLDDREDLVFEREPLEKLAKDNELMAFKHEGFWQCMDTQRDKFLLEDLWAKGTAPWKNW